MAEKRMLITRPAHDTETHYLHAWGRKVIEAADKKGIKVLDLPDRKANKRTVHNYLDKHKPGLVVFNGHGNERTIAGHRDEPLIQMNSASALKGKIVYSISCKSASELGPRCVSKGTLSFAGYAQDFTFYCDTNKASRPLDDKVAAPCLDSTTQLAVSMVKGNTMEDAYQKSQARFRKWIKSFVSSKELEAPWIMQSLVDNMMNQRVIGDLKSCF